MTDSSSNASTLKVIATSRPISKEANLDPRSIGSKNMDLFDDINNRENNEASSFTIEQRNEEKLSLLRKAISKSLDFIINELSESQPSFKFKLNTNTSIREEHVSNSIQISMQHRESTDQLDDDCINNAQQCIRDFLSEANRLTTLINKAVKNKDIQKVILASNDQNSDAYLIEYKNKNASFFTHNIFLMKKPIFKKMQQLNIANQPFDIIEPIFQDQYVLSNSTLSYKGFISLESARNYKFFFEGVLDDKDATSNKSIKMLAVYCIETPSNTEESLFNLIN